MLRHTRSVLVVLLASAAASACDEDVAIVEEAPPLQPDASGSPPPGAGPSVRPDAGPAAPSVDEPPPSGGGGRGNDDGDDVTDTRPLPDLVLDTQYLVESAGQDFVEVDDSCLLQQRCVTGLGTRRVVRFGTRTGNAGTADLIVGRPDADNPLWRWDSCAENYQLEGYARYDLLGASGNEVLLGAKNGFCMRDSEGYELPEEACTNYDCDDQGITMGCADNYVAGLKCQWVDITGIDNGDYRIRVEINADRHLEELDYSNNVGFIDIRIATTEVSVLGP